MQQDILLWAVIVMAVVNALLAAVMARVFHTRAARRQAKDHYIDDSEQGRGEDPEGNCAFVF